MTIPDSLPDPLETAIIAASVAVLRRRAAQQRANAERWSPPGSVATGESRIADRIAEALGDVADEIERDAKAGATS